jgi:DHA1 family bicyclomycin/chloramphenicol resistance-like MFS transporter
MAAVLRGLAAYLIRVTSSPMNNDPAVQPRHGWQMAIVIGQLAFGLMAMTICLPSMQDWPAIFGAGQAGVQLVFSGYVAAYGGMQLVYGAVSDRVGRKPVLLTGLALACVGSALAAVAPTLPMLVAARVLQGAGAAAGMVIGRALVQDLFTGRERTRVMALVGMTMGLVPPLAMVIGGQLHVRLGWQANFALAAAVGVALFVAAWRGLPDTRPPRSEGEGWGTLVTGYARLLRMPAFLLYVVMLASTTSTFYTFLGGAPLVLKGYGVTPEQIGWYVMSIPVAYMFGNILTTRLIQRRGDRSIMAIGQALTVAGLLGVLVLGLGGWHTALALALPLMLLGIGHGLLAPPTLTGTVGLVPALAGSAAAVAGLMQQLTGAFGGFVVGLMPHQGPVNLGLVMLAFTACGVLAQVLLFGGLLRRA